VAERTAPVFDAWLTGWAYGDALATTHASAATWQAHQAARLGSLLDEVAPRARAYRERLAHASRGDRLAHGGRGGDALSRLARMAPVRKRELMCDFDAWVTDPALTLPALQSFVRDRARRGEAFLGRYLVWESSGSSGEPALFVQDARSLAVADALEAARGPVAQMGSAAPRIALVGATDGHFASVVSFERVRALNPWLAFSSHSFSFLQPIERLVEQLNAFAPQVLASYPSMAWVLSEEQRAGRLSIAPHALWTGGETLTPALRACLSERFGAAPVRDSYGASECLWIAGECRHGRLHLNADWVVLEPVDARGRPVPPGQVGATTLLTNLANRVQPIIRYDLGDRVRFVPEACDCGSSLPVIEVQGRCDDLLTLADARGHAVHLAPLALVTVLEDAAGVFDFRLRQRGEHALRLDLFGCTAADGVRAVDALRAYLHSVGLGTARVEVHREAACPRGRSGKQQRIVRDEASLRGAAPRPCASARRAPAATA
jgi:phenylacetate-coenzyme A ligase PaaK-like adenylate-forming protein